MGTVPPMSMSMSVQPVALIHRTVSSVPAGTLIDAGSKLSSSQKPSASTRTS